MPKPTFNIADKRSSDAVAEAFPGNPPSSPNAPENMEAAHQKAQRELTEIRAERIAREDAVRTKPLAEP
jgi:hypothetical protein